MKHKASKILLSLLIINSVTYSCSTQTPTTTDTKATASPQASLKTGSEVDVKFVDSFEPVLKVGTKIVLISTSPGIEPIEASTEITAVEGDVYTVKITNPDGTKEIKGKNEDFEDDVPKTGIIYEGTEDVKVPAGEYKSATKVSFTNSQGTKVILWLVKGIGPVKRIDTQANARVITTELKEFKN